MAEREYAARERGGQPAAGSPQDGDRPDPAACDFASFDAADPADPANLIDPGALARAEAALAALAGRYLAWAEADARALADALQAAQAAPDGPAAHLPGLFRLAHDIKGQAATFGYPLVTEIAARLSRRLKRLADGGAAPDAAEMDAVAALAAGLCDVVARNLAGDGGAEGRAILARLPAAPRE